MTKEFYQIIFKPGNTPERAASDIKYNYLTEVKHSDKSGKERQSELFLIGDIWQWKKYLIENKLKPDNLPDNIKFKVPEKFLKKKVETKPGIKIDFEDKIKLYEKHINL